MCRGGGPSLAEDDALPAAYREGIFEDGGSQNAPAQRMADFVAGRSVGADLPRLHHAPGIHAARIDRLPPAEIAGRLRKGFSEFGRKQPGFLTNEAVLDRV